MPFWFSKRRPAAAPAPEETLPPQAHKLTAAEQSSGVIRSPDLQRVQRLPPGQSRAKKWPVLHVGSIPTLDRWELRLFGAVAAPVTLTWDQLQALPQVTVQADMHCVTSWSRLDQAWLGVSTQTLMDLARVDPAAAFVVAHGHPDYTTNMPLRYVQAKDSLVAFQCNGEPLTPEHGGPLRLVVPQLYAWKSAKWLSGLEFLVEDRAGFWESNGYHARGDPWLEERYSAS